jgi:hypothetical protein
MDRLMHRRMLGDDAVDGRARRSNENTQPQRCVLPLATFMKRLYGQGKSQVAAIALKHTQPAAHHVMQHLVASAVFDVVDHANDVHARFTAEASSAALLTTA